jgi:hypothetical protein
MSADLLHNHPQFADLIRIVAERRRIDPALVEKDYWLMHCLYGLQQLGLMFELKGGTSLSKGYQIINRFSEDIDIRIEPPKEDDVKTGRNQNSPAHVQSRRDFYDWLAKTIRIDGIERVERDTAFDDRLLRSAGIRLIHKTLVLAMAGLKLGVLLEGLSSTTAPKASLAIILGIPSSKSSRRFRQNSVCNEQHRTDPLISCAIIMMFTVCFSGPR